MEFSNREKTGNENRASFHEPGTAQTGVLNFLRLHLGLARERCEW